MKISGGYYIKARKIQESEIAFAPPYTREIWDWLLKEANHQTKKYKGFKVERGQLFRTYKDIIDGLAWYVGWRKMTYNENHVKKAMKFLREHRMVATRKALGGVLITICNYELYQDPKNYERTKERTNERTVAEPRKHQTLPDNNKKEKNGIDSKESQGILFSEEPTENNESSKKKTNPDVSKFIKWWFNKYNQQFGEKYIVAGGKEGSIVKDLLSVCSFDELVKLAETFFDTDDEFVENAGYTIGVFKSQINKLNKKSKKKDKYLR